MPRCGIICEESLVVRREFERRGWDAWSCDILPRPGQHLRGDARDFDWSGFDLLICFPPCTHLSASGAASWHIKRRRGQQQEAIALFRSMFEFPCDRIAVENPVGIMSTEFRKPDQIIHPWQFGHEASKTTCLWLKGLPKLEPTRITGKGEFRTYRSGKRIPTWYTEVSWLPAHQRRKARSKTFPGIARAMADQWGAFVEGRMHEVP